ncbi:MAG: DUF72 domain-containing protein [Limnochordaceae bacterium]|nr:DUF72 domain-containing protein [Limnochordaceae bacterium]
MLWLGTCGWSLSQAKYFRQFNAIEIQQTFYEPPRIGTALRWKRSAPEHFAFAVKAWQLVTHPASSPTYRRLRTPLDEQERAACGFFRDAPVVEEAMRRTLEVADALGARVVLFQTPASFAPEPANVAALRSFFTRYRREGSAFVWEPRGPWPDDLVRSLCEELGLVHGTDPFRRPALTRGVIYYRLHGVGGYGHRYTDAEIQELARRVSQHLESQEDIWCFFNNVTMAEDAARLAATLRLPGH